MCGIAGIFAYKDSAPAVDPDELTRIRDYMIRRGPDGKGQWLSEDGRVGLAHRRLSIIDLSYRAAQPMTDPHTGSVITYNGEIYNYRELRERLKGRGCEFISDSDTEVLLHLYRLKGEGMLEDLRGMYAFAIWEPGPGRLFCARDPYGIKPLYYSDEGRTLRLASQVKALLAGGRLSSQVSPAGKAGFYLWGSVPEPWTWIEGIRALPAGHSLTVSRNGAAELRAYDRLTSAWGPDQDSRGPSPSRAIKESVAAHLVADVPVGLFLSSGIDSCVLLALMNELGVNSPQCITLGFDEFDNRAEDETGGARVIAGRYGAEHCIVRYTPNEIEEVLPQFLAAMDQPSIDGLNTWLISRAARGLGLKVAISGLGGDELVGGYPSFQDIPRWVRHWGRFRFLSHAKGVSLVMGALSRLPVPPKGLALPILGGDWASAYLLRRGIFMPWELSQVMGKEEAAEGLRALQPLEAVRLTLRDLDDGTINHSQGDLARVAVMESSFYLRNQLLRDADWAGMDNSVEIRTPLVDRRLLARIAPASSSRERENGKDILASTPSPSLPAHFRARPKTGFTLPMSRWLQTSTLKPLWNKSSCLRSSRCHWSRRWLHTVSQAYQVPAA